MARAPGPSQSELTWRHPGGAKVAGRSTGYCVLVPGGSILKLPILIAVEPCSRRRAVSTSSERLSGPT